MDRSIPINSNDVLSHGSVTLAMITGVTNSISHANALLITGKLTNFHLNYIEYEKYSKLIFFQDF